jgi:hypothetical protein
MNCLGCDSVIGAHALYDRIRAFSESQTFCKQHKPQAKRRVLPGRSPPKIWSTQVG